MLSENGRGRCGREDRDLYEMLLRLEEIEHPKIKVGRLQSNGFIERFHRTLPEEHLRVKGADDLVRVRRGDAGGSGRLSKEPMLQPSPEMRVAIFVAKSTTPPTVATASTFCQAR